MATEEITSDQLVKETMMKASWDNFNNKLYEAYKLELKRIKKALEYKLAKLEQA